MILIVRGHNLTLIIIGAASVLLVLAWWIFLSSRELDKNALKELAKKLKQPDASSKPTAR
jgi:hypothetical protein